MKVSIRQFNKPSEDYKQALALRYKMLREPLGLHFTPAELEKDLHDLHFGLFLENEIAACLTLTVCEGRRMKMRQVATAATLHGKGYGRQLNEAAENFARSEGFKTMFCNARKTAVPFYQRLGYAVVSEEFLEVGIPHFVMEKGL